MQCWKPVGGANGKLFAWGASLERQSHDQAVIELVLADAAIVDRPVVVAEISALVCRSDRLSIDPAETAKVCEVEQAEGRQSDTQSA
jgi:hypothetical protein